MKKFFKKINTITTTTIINRKKKAIKKNFYDQHEYVFYD